MGERGLLLNEGSIPVVRGFNKYAFRFDVCLPGNYITSFIKQILFLGIWGYNIFGASVGQ